MLAPLRKSSPDPHLSRPPGGPNRGFRPQNYAGAATKKLPRPALFARPRGPGLYQKGGFGHKTVLAPLQKKLPRPALFPALGGPGPHLFRPPPRLARGAPPAAPPRFQYENRGQGTPQRRVRTSAHSPIQSGHLGKIRIPRRVVQPAAPARNSLHWLLLWQRRNAERNFSAKNKKNPKKNGKNAAKLSFFLVKMLDSN